MKAKTGAKKENTSGDKGTAKSPNTGRKTVTVSFKVFEDEEVYIKEMVKQILKKKRNGYS